MTQDELEIPNGYYIDMNGGSSRSFGRFKRDQYGKCTITVYKGLDACQNAPIQHLQRVGHFVINEVQDMQADDFLRNIKEGIEKVIKSEVDLPISVK